jgi:hypothetical protein
MWRSDVTEELRGLRHPVRTLPDAIADITARLEQEFDGLETPLQRRTEIIERVAQLGTVLMNHGG